MAATTPRPDDEPASTPIPRFDRVERWLHWANAALFTVVMLTSSVLYIGQLSAVVGHREVVRALHVYCGLAIPAVFALALIPGWGRAAREDARRINRWTDDDIRWLRTRGRGAVRLGKFNPGQKLNAAFLTATTVVMLATGSIMRWFEPFSNNTRTGATFVHDWIAFFIWVAVLGHVFLALRDPEALHGMTRGTVSTAWARRHRPGWLAEVRARGNGVANPNRREEPVA